MVSERALMAAALGLLVAGCLDTTASPSSGRVPSPSTRPTPGAATPAGAWNTLDAAGLSSAHIEDVATVPDGFVAVGCVRSNGRDCEAPAAWISPDAVTWSGPFRLPLMAGEQGGMARAAATTGPGLLVGGATGRAEGLRAALWFSEAAAAFERIGGLPSADDATVLALAGPGERAAAVGAGGHPEFAGFRAWSSTDGRTWRDRSPAGGDEAFPAGVIARGDGFIAWGPTCSVCPAETAWWISDEDGRWERTEVDLGASFSHVQVVGEVPAGLVAFGTTGIDPPRPAGWFLANSADRWRSEAGAPVPVPGIVRAHLLIGHGSVLAGTASHPTGSRGLVWFRGPGESAWRLTGEFPDMELVAVVQDPVRPERLVVIGRATGGDGDGATVIRDGAVDWSP